MARAVWRRRASRSRTSSWGGNNAAYFVDRTDSDAAEDEQCDQAVGTGAPAFVLLAAESDADFITGKILTVAGDETMRR